VTRKFLTQRRDPFFGEEKPQMKTAELSVATLAGLLICVLTVRGEESKDNVELRVENILNQMTLDEKLSYIGGTGFWDIKPIPRLGLPQIFMENGLWVLLTSRSSLRQDIQRDWRSPLPGIRTERADAEDRSGKMPELVVFMLI
jgi:hypothetical protein